MLDPNPLFTFRFQTREKIDGQRKSVRKVLFIREYRFTKSDSNCDCSRQIITFLRFFVVPQNVKKDLTRTKKKI